MRFCTLHPRRLRARATTSSHVSRRTRASGFAVGVSGTGSDFAAASHSPGSPELFQFGYEWDVDDAGRVLARGLRSYDRVSVDEVRYQQCSQPTATMGRRRGGRLTVGLTAAVPHVPKGDMSQRRSADIGAASALRCDGVVPASGGRMNIAFHVLFCTGRFAPLGST